MRLLDSIKRVFLTEQARQMEADAAGGGRSTNTPDEWTAEHEYARKVVLEPIRDEGVFWP